jgi:curved DNA-binding protein
MVTLEEAFKGAVRPITLRRPVLCQHCFGTGQVNQHRCTNCGGSGHTDRQDTYKVKIPAGVREGQQLRVAGQGEAGVGKGAAGDLYLRVHFAKHPEFRVENDHLYYDADLAPWEAVLGANISVPTLEGVVSIKIPPGTQNGHVLRVRGRGLPIRTGGAGDLHVVTRVQTPSKVTPAEKELWEQLARESRFKPRD